MSPCQVAQLEGAKRNCLTFAEVRQFLLLYQSALVPDEYCHEATF